MRFTWRAFFAGFLALGTFTACEDDLDANADYEEIAIIYSLLDSSQPVQYVKVTKAFVNPETDALYIAANEPDSTKLHPITVELRRLSPNSDSTVLESFVLNKIPVAKDDGLFSTSDQFVYASDSNQIALQDNQLYQVVVTNTVTGKRYTAATRVVNSVCVGQVGYDPVPTACDPNSPSQALVPYGYQNLRFDLVPNGRIYKATYYLIYKEHWPNRTTADSVDIDTVEFAPVNNRIILATGSHNEVLEPNRMYQQMLNAIDISNDDTSTYRTMEPCVVKVTGGGLELARYVQVNNAYSAILQSRPEYSNIQNGAGLFSSRNTQIVKAHFTQKAIDSLIIRYPDLKFRD